jgi:hypothetical protein
MDFKDFLKTPLDFMEDNLVIPTAGVLGDETPSMENVQTLRLVDTNTMVKCLIPNKNGSIKKWRLEPAKNGDENAFDAYWLNYRSDRTYTCLLGKKASFMFTATMNGCTFGAGNETPEGNRLVGHANVSKETAHPMEFTRQQLRQTNSLQDMIGELGVLLNPSGYSLPGTDQYATTFGIRNADTSDSWEFYTQVYRRVGTDYTFMYVNTVYRNRT